MPKFSVTAEVLADREAFEVLVKLEVLHTVLLVGSNRDRENPLPAVDKFSEHILKPLRKGHKPATGRGKGKKSGK
ncbi:hypothetical protein LCGC14_1175820 [marine sediment metagenome]|uniref:Uncharacterized protein n=1 Tax=marine sediment metagenome TaxID=412755 RepID=A0A0F9P6K9_9ZZZZ